jgi:hypothetical protein
MTTLKRATDTAKSFGALGEPFDLPEEFRCIRANEAMDTYSIKQYLLVTNGAVAFLQLSEDDEEVVREFC